MLSFANNYKRKSDVPCPTKPSSLKETDADRCDYYVTSVLPSEFRRLMLLDLLCRHIQSISCNRRVQPHTINAETSWLVCLNQYDLSIT